MPTITLRLGWTVTGGMEQHSVPTYAPLSVTAVKQALESILIQARFIAAETTLARMHRPIKDTRLIQAAYGIMIMCLEQSDAATLLPIVSQETALA